MNQTTAVPLLNLALGLAVMIYLIVFIARRRSELPHEVISLHMLALALLVGLLITSAQQLADGDADATDALTITAVKFAAIWILFSLRNTLYRTGTRHDDHGAGRNADSDNPDREVQA